MGKEEIVMSKARNVLEALGIIKDYEYLLHHLHPGEDKKGTEELHHCNLYDHLCNLFTQEHLVVKDGKAYVNGKVVKDGTYHIVAGLEPTQDINWSDEEATKSGIKPKILSPGMKNKEKGKIW